MEVEEDPKLLPPSYNRLLAPLSVEAVEVVGKDGNDTGYVTSPRRASAGLGEHENLEWLVGIVVLKVCCNEDAMSTLLRNASRGNGCSLEHGALNHWSCLAFQEGKSCLLLMTEVSVVPKFIGIFSFVSGFVVEVEESSSFLSPDLNGENTNAFRFKVSFS